MLNRSTIQTEFLTWKIRGHTPNGNSIKLFRKLGGKGGGVFVVCGSHAYPCRGWVPPLGASVPVLCAGGPYRAVPGVWGLADPVRCGPAPGGYPQWGGLFLRVWGCYRVKQARMTLYVPPVTTIPHHLPPRTPMSYVADTHGKAGKSRKVSR